jgi:hypothetical protein
MFLIGMSPLPSTSKTARLSTTCRKEKLNTIIKEPTPPPPKKKVYVNLMPYNYIKDFCSFAIVGTSKNKANATVSYALRPKISAIAEKMTD